MSNTKAQDEQQCNQNKSSSASVMLEKTTPMIKQYIRLKSANPGYLLFYRMGDFYELFFDDAVIAARALGIMLTKRGKHLGEDIPMCGVPIHTADDYLHKLIASGYRIALCEQTEDSAEAKKRGIKSLVKREVIRLVTPGTLTEEKLLDPARANYLMSLGYVKNRTRDKFALAWIDISTGTFRVAVTQLDRLLTDIMRVDPQELIFADDIFYDEKLQSIFDVVKRIAFPQSPCMFDPLTAKARISRYYQVATIDGFSTFSQVELAAISGVIAYIEKTQINEHPSLMRPERADDFSMLFIDSASRLSLELTHTLSGERDGSLIRAIDRTVTCGGARILAERLMTPLTNPDIINERFNSIAFFLKEEDLCQTIRLKLKGLADISRALSRLAVRRGGPRDFSVILRGFQIAKSFNTLLKQFSLSYELAEIVMAIEAVPISLMNHLDNALADELPLLKGEGNFIRSGYHAELDEMRALRDESRCVIASLQKRYAEETGVKSLKIKYNNLLGFFIEATTVQSAALTQTEEAKARFIHRQSIANAMRFTTAELIKLENRIANAAEKALTIELEIFSELTQEVTAVADLLRNGATALCILDVSAALATLAEERGYCRPVIDNSLSFHVVGGRHPIVEQAMRRQSDGPFIRNDCNLSPGNGDTSGVIHLLTGPNMGGKSTFLRQNALITIMAQMGSFVPAISAHIGIVDKLFSRVGASDNLASGRSTFMVEMVETAAILNQATKRSFVIVDEIGRGTSTFDGLSIAWAALEYLHEINCCRTIFATHFHELTTLSQKLPRLYNRMMKVQEWNGNVVFLHEVGSGIADRSYGVQVAELAGLPKVVISRAYDVLYQLEQSEMLNGQRKLIDDLPFCSIKTNQKGEGRSISSPTVIEMLCALKPDNLTPRKALDELYKLKSML